MKYLRTAVVLLSVIASLPGNLLAMVPTPLPALRLTSANGQLVTNQGLPNKGNWLLVYVHPRSHFCDDMLKLLQTNDSPSPVAGMVIVVDGSIDDLQGLQAKYPNLAGAAWYADLNHEAFGALKLRGFPVVIGVTQQTMEWMLHGVVPDPDSFRSALNNWLQRGTQSQ